MVGLLLVSLAWGAVGAWAVNQHASAAQDVVATSEPLSLSAQQMYRSLSDADVTATAAFLSGPYEPLGARTPGRRSTPSATRCPASWPPSSRSAWPPRPPETWPPLSATSGWC
jgi:hypothetical protein